MDSDVTMGDQPATIGDTSTDGSRWWLRPHWLISAATFVVSIPLIVGIAVLHGRRWYPVLDLAMTELRVRDVFGRHSPLIGLPGRIGNFPDQGSHPGPISFFVLAPIYRVFGSSAWSLELGMVLLNIVAIGAVLTLAHRRAGWRGLAIATVAMAGIVHGYGTEVLSQPWNPYFPLLFWVVVLVSTWSVLCGDRIGLVGVAVAGSLCAQTHVPYLALWLGLLALCAAAIVWQARSEGPAERRRTIRVVLGTVGLILVLWLPPIIDQLIRDPGNLRMLFDHFTSDHEEAPIGLGAALRLWLRHLDLIRPVTVDTNAHGRFVEIGFQSTGPVWPGLLLLAAWAGSVAVAVRRRVRPLLAMQVVVAAGFVLTIISMGQIFGKVWYYLTLWAWSVAVLTAICVLWAAVLLVVDRRPRWRQERALLPVAMVVLLAFVVSESVTASDAEPPEVWLSRSLGAVVDDTARALRDGVGAADGPDGWYVVRWEDSVFFGSQGYGLVSELERDGLHVGVPPTWRVPVTPQRVVPPGAGTAEVHFVTGSYLADFEGRADAVEVARFEPRSPAELVEYDELHQVVVDHLTEDGLQDLLPSVEDNLFGASLDPRVDSVAVAAMSRMLILGREIAVFITPVDPDIP